MRYVEAGVNELVSRGHCHGGVVKGSAKINILATDTLELDQWVIRGHLRVIAVAVRLRQAIQLTSAETMGVTVAKRLGYMGNMRAPMVVGRTLGREDLEVRGTVRVKHLACRQQQQAAIVGRRVRGIRRWRHRIQRCAVELEETDWEAGPTSIATARNDGPDDA